MPSNSYLKEKNININNFIRAHRQSATLPIIPNIPHNCYQKPISKTVSQLRHENYSQKASSKTSLRIAAAHSCSRKLCCSSKQVFLKAVPESWLRELPQNCAGKLAKAAPESGSPKLLPKAVPQSVPQSYSPKRLPRAAPQSCCRKLLPKVTF